MNLARGVCGPTGVSGLALLLPLFVMVAWIGKDYPPAIGHPEFHYGMMGTSVAWKAGFLAIASAPHRYRRMMLATLLEKFILGNPAIVLYAPHRIPAATLGFGLDDLVFGHLFAWCAV